jgi:hypothetical protein
MALLTEKKNPLPKILLTLTKPMKNGLGWDSAQNRDHVVGGRDSPYLLPQRDGTLEVHPLPQGQAPTQSG